MLIDVTNPITDWIFPRRCLVCNVDLSEGEICVFCFSLCNVCPNPLFSDNQKSSALFLFEYTMRQLIKEAKFNKNPAAVHLLIKLIKNQLIHSDLYKEIKKLQPTAVTYVPSHWFNRIMRGVELPRLFAAVFACELNIPVVSLLARRRFFHRQALRERKTERRALIRGSYIKKRNVRHYERLLLVDDIVTTGATFDESKKVLKDVSGHIYSVAIAKTP